MGDPPAAPAPNPRWMADVLFTAGLYNLAWGAWAIAAPQQSFAYSGMEFPGKPLNYPALWQCIGMVVGVYGVGYLLASRDPVRHWPVVLVGLLGKVFGPVGLLFGVLTGQGRPQGLYTVIPNDLIWWVPFGLILHRAYRLRGNA